MAYAAPLWQSAVNLCHQAAWWHVLRSEAMTPPNLSWGRGPASLEVKRRRHSGVSKKRPNGSARSASRRDVAASHLKTAVAAAGTLRRHIRRLLLRQQGRCGVTLSDCCCGSRDVAASHSQTAVAAAENLEDGAAWSAWASSCAQWMLGVQYWALVDELILGRQDAWRQGQSWWCRHDVGGTVPAVAV